MLIVKAYAVDEHVIKISVVKEGSRYRQSPAVLIKGGVELSGDVKHGVWHIVVKGYEVDAEVEGYSLSIRFDEDKDHIRITGDLGVDDYVFGLGEKALPLNRRRFRVTMWNTDAYGYRLGSDPLYVSIPFMIILRNKVAVGHFFDSTARMILDLGVESEDKYVVRVYDTQVDYYLIAGPLVRDVISRYLKLTGMPALMPKWALGPQQSRWSYYPQSRVLEIARKYRDYGIPLSAIYLDIDYMDGYRIFTWSSERFPDPASMIRELHEMGVKVVTIIDPYVKLDPTYPVFRSGIEGNYLSTESDGGLAVIQGWPGRSALPDFFNSRVRDWWAGLVEGWVRGFGIDGIWLDMNEPAAFDYRNHTVESESIQHMLDDGFKVPHNLVHNAYALYEAMATYEGLRRVGRRPFILSRAGYAGIQRYAAIWTGDNTSNWDHLKLQLSILLSLSISGVAFIGADVGGFAKNVPEGGGSRLYLLDKELIVRWYEAYALFPLFRNHSSKDSPDQEPWRFGPTVLEAIKSVVNLRERLRPYLYTLMWLSHINGEPIVRPLFYDFQDDEEVVHVDDEYMVGPFILVAPVLDKGVDSRVVYLPKGSWTHLWSGVKYGQGHHTVKAPWGQPPIFLRDGSVVPMASGNALELLVTPGNGEFTIYDDDGESIDPVPSTLRVTVRGLNVDVGHWINPTQYTPRVIVVKVYGVDRPKGVLVNGVQVQEGSFKYEPGPPMWFFEGGSVYVRVPEGSSISLIY